MSGFKSKQTKRLKDRTSHCVKLQDAHALIMIFEVKLLPSAYHHRCDGLCKSDLAVWQLMRETPVCSLSSKTTFQVLNHLPVLGKKKKKKAVQRHVETHTEGENGRLWPGFWKERQAGIKDVLCPHEERKVTGNGKGRLTGKQKHAELLTQNMNKHRDKLFNGIVRGEFRINSWTSAKNFTHSFLQSQISEVWHFFLLQLDLLYSWNFTAPLPFAFVFGVCGEIFV